MPLVLLAILITLSFSVTTFFLWLLLLFVSAWGFWIGAVIFWIMWFIGNAISRIVIPLFGSYWANYKLRKQCSGGVAVAR